MYFIGISNILAAEEPLGAASRADPCGRLNSHYVDQNGKVFTGDSFDIILNKCIDIVIG
jgi:hypothetical protein